MIEGVACLSKDRSSPQPGWTAAPDQVLREIEGNSKR